MLSVQIQKAGTLSLMSITRCATQFLITFLLLSTLSCADGSSKNLPPYSSPLANSTATETPENRAARIVTLESPTPAPSPTPIPATVTPTEAASPISTPASIDPSAHNDMLAIGSKLWIVPEPDTVVDLPLDVGARNQPWSPDGHSLAGWDRQNQELVILDLEEWSMAPVPNSTASYSVPYWSPDGARLLYAIPGTTPTLSTVVVYDLDTQAETTVAEDVELLSLSGWSHDSQEIGFVYANGGQGTTLEVVNIESAEYVTLTLPDSNIEAASWSPVSKQLLLYATPGDAFYNPALPIYLHRELYLASSPTGDVIRLAGDSTDNNAYYIHNSPWTPDGQSIVYSNGGTICFLELSTGEESCPSELNEKITTTGALGAHYPGWSPDGQWLAFILKYESQQCSPFAVAPADGSALYYTDSQTGACSVFGPVWSGRGLR